MTYLAGRLKKRIDIRVVVQVPNDAGGFTKGFVTVSSIWAEIKSKAQASTANASNVNYIRGQQVNESVTHEFIVRKIAVRGLRDAGFGSGFSLGMDKLKNAITRAFNQGFDIGFDSVVDVNAVKGEFYIFMRFEGREDKGRLFRVLSAVDKNEREEFIIVKVREVEEKGTGAPE